MTKTTSSKATTTAPRTPRKVSRVTVAKDVLKWLDAGKLVAEAGGYGTLEPSSARERKAMKDCWRSGPLDAVSGKTAEAISEYGISDTRTVLKNPAVRCRVCALGAAFCAYTMRVNGTKSYWDRDKLAEVFPRLQMDYMETAFERGECGDCSSGWEYDQGAACIAFGKRYKSDNARLRAIMRNVIANRGEFDPTAPRKRRVAA